MINGEADAFTPGVTSPMDCEKEWSLSRQTPESWGAEGTSGPFPCSPVFYLKTSPGLGCSSHEDSYPSLADQPSLRVNQGDTGAVGMEEECPLKREGLMNVPFTKAHEGADG